MGQGAGQYLRKGPGCASSLPYSLGSFLWASSTH